MDRIERMMEFAWEFKAKYDCFALLLWDTEIGFWYSGPEDYLE